MQPPVSTLHCENSRTTDRSWCLHRSDVRHRTYGECSFQSVVLKFNLSLHINSRTVELSFSGVLIGNILNTFAFGYAIGYGAGETSTGSMNGNFLGSELIWRSMRRYVSLPRICID